MMPSYSINQMDLTQSARNALSQRTMNDYIKELHLYEYSSLIERHLTLYKQNLSAKTIVPAFCYALQFVLDEKFEEHKRLCGLYEQQRAQETTNLLLKRDKACVAP